MDKVSVIVRTCGRPHILENCLNSIRNQTYGNIEIIVVEDGKNISEKIIAEKFSDLPIKYHSTADHVGRAAAGNTGMQLASGKYLNFLDDDDEYYPDHIETLVDSIQKCKCRVVYSAADELYCHYCRKKGRYINLKKKVKFSQPFNRMQLYFENYLPIQTVMFEKSLFDELGGFRVNVDYLEDWDLWVKYSTVTDFEFVNKVTSFYRVPIISVKRDVNLRKARRQIQKCFMEYSLELNVGICNRELNEFVKNKYTSPVRRLLYKMGRKLLYRGKNET